MLEAGEDPLYVARRLVRFASEDVGNADPAALGAHPRRQGGLRLSGLARGRAGPRPGHLYLALAPKSNAAYVAFNEAQAGRARPAIRAGAPAPPERAHEADGHLGYGAGYQYAHDAPDALVDQEHLPESLRGRRYYRPVDRGLEAGAGPPARRMAPLASRAEARSTLNSGCQYI